MKNLKAAHSWGECSANIPPQLKHRYPVPQRAKAAKSRKTTAINDLQPDTRYREVYMEPRPLQFLGSVQPAD